ncbi:MAG: MBL fold metallo-hydrolase [Solirubrobacteraceae bacterium]|nr:MBL fold metallo-hydrolase [Patulibacter sp.]
MSTIHRISRFGLMNAFLVDEDDGFTLVDTMLGADQKILGAAAGLGKPIVRIALTHAHGDHIGSLDALKAALPEAEVSISVRDARLLAKDMSHDPGEEGTFKGDYRGAKTTPDVLLSAGDRVGSLEVVAAPGHTPGHVAFLDTRDGALICGDAFATVGAVATCAKPAARFPLTGFGTWNRDLALESARALRALDPTSLAPGHGKIVTGPVAAMDAAIARTEKALA